MYHTLSLNQGILVIAVVEKTFNHSAFKSAPVMKLAITVGAIIIEEAKITGMTPAELILIGKKLACDILADPLLPECWTGIFLLESSTNTTKQTMRR